MKKKLWQFYKMYRDGLTYLLIINILLVLPATFMPIYKMVFTDDILVDERSGWMPLLMAVMAGTALFSAVLQYLKSRCIIRMKNKIEVSGASRYYWSLIHRPLGEIQSQEPSKLLAGLNRSSRTADLMTTGYISIIFDLVSVITYFIMMLYVDWLMAFVVVGLILATHFLGWLIRTIQAHFASNEADEEEEKKWFGQLRAESEKINYEGLQKIEVFKSMASETRFFTRLLNNKAGLMNFSRNEDTVSAYEPLEDLPETFFMNVLLLVCALKIMDVSQSFSIGTYLALETYAGIFFGAVGSLLDGLDSLKSFAESLEETPADEAVAEPEVLPERLRGEIKFDHVSFGYDQERPVLKDISLTVKAGERVALVGQPGSGKTALLQLLAGLYPPDEGQVLIDGQPVLEIDPCVFSSSVGMAAQNIVFFTDSIRNNISLWDEQVTNAEIYEAATDACIHDFISGLKGAYDHPIMEFGRNLSGGQQQRVELARALLYQPSILLMDEATAFIDPATAARIEENIMRRGCTCLTATHLMQNTQSYDRIIVLEAGEIVAEGSHQELMNDASGFYARAFAAESVVAYE